MVALDDPRGDDPDHAGVPAGGGKHVGAALTHLGGERLGLPADPLLDRAAVGVDGIELGGDRLSALRILGQQQLQPRVGAPHAAGGVDPRRQPEGQAGGVERARIGTRDRASAHAGPAAASPPSARVRRARSGGSRRAAASGRRPSPARRARGPAPRSGRPKRLGKLVRDRGAAQVARRVAADHRVHDRAVRQLAVGTRACDGR